MKKYHIYFLILCLSFMACSGRKSSSDVSAEIQNSTPQIDLEEADTLIPSDKPVLAPSERTAGEILSDADLNDYPLDRWFFVDEISDSLYRFIEGRSFNEQTPVGLSSLRYLRILHVDFENNVRIGELICNKAIAEDVKEIFRTLYLSGYPIEKVRLVEVYDADDGKSMAANNTSCFNTRMVAGSHKLSKHAYGMAIDINPLYNPMVKMRNGKLIILPEISGDYADRNLDFKYKIDLNDLAYKEFRAKGFRWGGNWRTAKDYQHFEKDL